MKEDVKFIDEKITEFQESADKRKTDINECRKQILYSWLGENNRNEEEEEEEEEEEKGK